ncbi:hypothetical protein EGR_10596 [Echinococcus granulosus]|uniref:Uncharacterized protein n=1 Tax=Echinococcus granulosus TaxID=6210 RepID=W6UM32_ECHGR|nr:hypothetical protein EGR_10596 [Echinococcus granulosus]EUB54554.1 hypothetical protein EGR_10596 [Echinococcus granulosus]
MPHFVNSSLFMRSIASNPSFWLAHLREVVEAKEDTLLESAVNVDVNAETTVEGRQFTTSKEQSKHSVHTRKFKFHMTYPAHNLVMETKVKRRECKKGKLKEGERWKRWNNNLPVFFIFIAHRLL